jgi:small-conductance mechanosensitive channel
LRSIVYVSSLALAYFDYKLYPSFGINPGLGYALNTISKYTAFGIGFLIALNFLGLNLQFLLVFTGAIGIGIGLGLQNMAANVNRCSRKGLDLLFSECQIYSINKIL